MICEFGFTLNELRSPFILDSSGIGISFGVSLMRLCGGFIAISGEQE